MSIFGKIMGAIFGNKAEAAPSIAPGSTPAAAPGSTPSVGHPANAAPSVGQSTASSSNQSGTAAATPAKTVEVGPILDAAVKSKGEKLEWRTSIVDLMKALDIDSSLTARKELAKELNFTGDTNDSATMNIWLHKEVVAKLAANGGKLPDDMKH